MQLDMAFGKSGLRLNLPGGFDYHVLEARSARALADSEAALRDAIAPLSALAIGKKTAAISVCDITRPVPNRVILPHLLSTLEHAGVHAADITILIATGLHRPATDGEIREICGEDTASRYRVVNHNARALAEHRHLGTTAAGTPVYIDERFMAADLHITVGFIEPHLMLGFSGGRKLIAPGLAAQETIKVIHSPKFMREPRAVEGSIADNPIHRELLEISRMARHDFMVDVSLTRTREIAGVFAGDPRQAHPRGVEFVSRTMLEQLEEPVDAVITTAAGYPLDLTYYQAIKGVTAASHIVKPGGRILLMAACAEGCGAEEFSRMVRENPSDREFMKKLLRRPVEVDQWQLEKLGLVTARAELLYYLPGLAAEYHPSLWGKSCATPEAALAALTAGLEPGARIAVIPEGPYVLARAA